MATSIAWFAGFVLLSWDLGKQLKINYIKTIIPQILKIVSALIFSTALWLIFEYYWPSVGDESFAAMLLRFGVVICSGGIVYLAIALMLKLREPIVVLDLLKSKISKK